MNLSINDLTKSYGKKLALSNFSYTFEPGIYALLGANGAGKSTLFQLLTDTLRRDSGIIQYNCHEILKLGKEYRKIIGYMPQGQFYYKEMQVREFLSYMAHLKGISTKNISSQINHLLSVVDLKDASTIKMKALSGGMRQRILLAQALLGDPKIILLDEPTSGVDPEERIRIRSYISSIAVNKIVILATHIVSDIECIANQVILMKKGEIVKTGAPSALISTLYGKVSQKKCSFNEVNEYQQIYGQGIYYQREDGNMLRLINDYVPEGFSVVEDDIGMEEVFLYYCV